MFLLFWRGDLQIVYFFLVRKDFLHAGKELQQVEINAYCNLLIHLNIIIINGKKFVGYYRYIYIQLVSYTQH